MLGTFKKKIRRLTLVPAGGGCFEIKADGNLLYSKLETGEFPDEGWVVKALAERVQARR